MRTSFGLAGIFLLAFSPFCSAQAPVQGDKPVSVPFVLLPSRHMLLEVKVNGKGPYKLIFDTGAPLNLMNNKLAKDAGLLKKKSGGGLGFGLFGGMNQIEVEKLDVGGVIAENLPAVVMDHPTVQAISDAFEDEFGRIDGIVGFPFFGRFATTVDYQKKQITLKPTNYKPGDYLQDMTKSLMKMSEKSNQPRIVGAAGLWGFTVENSKDPSPGVLVQKVYPESPAAHAGLKAEDRILTIDGRWTDTVADTYLATSLVKPNRSAIVVVNRNGKEMKLNVIPVKGY